MLTYVQRPGGSDGSEMRLTLTRWERLRAGSLAHRRIGRATDRLVTTDSTRRVLLIGLIVVALLLFAQGMGVQVAHLPGR